MGILLTFSKSLLLIIPLIFMPYIIDQKNKNFIKVYICSFFFLVIFYNFLTNYVINPKNELILQDIDHSNYIDKNSDPLYENDKFSLHEFNYAQIKLKSIKIISKNFYWYWI